MRPAADATSAEWRAYWDTCSCLWCGGIRPAFIAEEPSSPRCMPQSCARTGIVSHIAATFAAAAIAREEMTDPQRLAERAHTFAISYGDELEAQMRAARAKL